jgi:hypothetical protein
MSTAVSESQEYGLTPLVRLRESARATRVCPLHDLDLDVYAGEVHAW